VNRKLEATRLPAGWLVLAGVVVAGATIVGVAFGAADLSLGSILTEFVNRVPGIQLHSGMGSAEAAVLWKIRLPRVVLGLLVGGMLAVAGSAYQGVFRNALADPYLLGVAAGAGLGATLAFVYGAGSGGFHATLLPVAAFAGSMIAVSVTYMTGSGGRGGTSTASLILSGVAVAAMLTAAQTYLQLRHTEVLRDVLSWVLGRLSTAGWREVIILLPYVVVSAGALLLSRRALDVLALGVEEASALGVNVRQVRIAVLLFASLGTAAAVSVSGLIGFVGIIVPHAVRMAVGTSYRRIIPLSLFAGAAFLVLADVIARSLMSPAELPIGVVTAFVGGPFFLVVLRSTRKALS